MNGVKNIQLVKPETACGLHSINHVFNTKNATITLDAAVSSAPSLQGKFEGQAI